MAHGAPAVPVGGEAAAAGRGPRSVAPPVPRARRPRRSRLGRRRRRDRTRGREARPSRRRRDPVGGGRGARRRVHGAGQAVVPRRPLRRHPAPDGAVQQLQLHERIALAGAQGPADEPRVDLDVPRADPARRLRPRHRGAERLGGAGLARGSGADHRRADRVRLAEGHPRNGPRREGAPRPEDDRQDAEGRRHVRLRRRRVERPAALAGRLAPPEAADGRRRELPQRPHRLVPRGHRVRPRDDRDRFVPPDPRHHRPQHPGRRVGLAQGVPRARQRRSLARSSSRPSPTCTPTRRTTPRGSARSATRSGTWG